MSVAPSRRQLLGGAGALAALAGGGAALRALARRSGVESRTRAGLAFGATVALTFAGPDTRALDAALDDAFGEIRAIERAASLMKPGSALARLNREGAVEAPDTRLVELTRFALALAKASAGAFDPTVQPFWPLWADATQAGRRPSPPELAAAAARVGWRDVEVSDDRIAYARPRMAMTLNGIVQGYAADRVVAIARARGATDALVDTGEFGAFGQNPEGRPWRLGGAKVDRPGETTAIADPFSGFAATSAGAGTPFSADASDNHLFDPRTGLSPKGVASVTVFAPSGLLADGLSTAVAIMGAEAGTALAARYEGCSLRLIPA